MTGMTAARNRLGQADDLPALLEAARQVFAVALTALRACEDPASVWFGRFVMAAASAADGRDAVIFASSMPGRRAHATTGTGEDSPAGAADTVAGDIASSCGLAAVRLAQAALSNQDQPTPGRGCGRGTSRCGPAAPPMPIRAGRWPADRLVLPSRGRNAPWSPVR
jgi:hypothetical protein